MELLRFTTAGSVDDGKSTLIGRLLHDSKGVYEDQLAAVKKSRINRSTGPIDFSLLTDGLRAEREQGITIDVAYRYFATPRRKFIIADTPGHEQYTRNMATGASTADLAVILVDATKGTIDKPRLYCHEGLPQGPAWRDVQRLIESVSDENPTHIRNRAVILLLAVYAFRINEVSKLTLDDIDWEAERLHVRRSKLKKVEEYPLATEVGTAILRYLKEVRPRSSRRELFLTLRAPYRPLSSASLGARVGTLVRRLGIKLAHYGPHALRHACATHLLAQGLSLKQIGDHLGHRSAQATRIYAKVDVSSLRQVADQTLAGLVECSEPQRQKTQGVVLETFFVPLREVANLGLGDVL
jgi:integrase